MIIYELFMFVILLKRPGDFSVIALTCLGVQIIVLGMLIILNPFTREGTQAQFTAVAMLTEAVIDIFLLIQSIRSKEVI